MEKEFIAKLEKFELKNTCDITAEEINAIINACKEESDPLDCAIWFAFQLGCMKTLDYIKETYFK